MKRIKYASKLAVVLTSLTFVVPALAGTWKDDFEDGNLNGWKAYTTDEIENMNPPWSGDLGTPLGAKAWSVKNGICVGNNLNGTDCVALGDNTWTDYSVQASIRILDATSSAENSAFIFIRLIDANNLYGAFIIPLSNPRIAFLAHPKSDSPWLDDVLLPVKLDTWYRLKLVAKGTHFDVYLDDSLITSFDDDAVPAGRIGLGIREVYAHFDNVIIEGDRIPDVSVRPKNKLVTTWAEVRKAL